MTEKDQLLHDLKALGVKEGDAVLVHSSMKALGTKLTPEEVIDALQESVGEKGTLLMPALTYENASGEHRVFDSGSTPPCIGLLPTVFWKQPGVERSLHPTHSVCARGALAHRLSVGHQMDDTAVGPHSPFMQLAVVGGGLLFIGDIIDARALLAVGLMEMRINPYAFVTDISKWI